MGLRKSLAASAVAISLACGGLVLLPSQAYAVPSQADLNEAQARIDEYGSQLITFQTELEQAEADLVRTDNEIEDTEVKIGETQAELAAARAVLASRMRSGYKSGSVNFLDVLFNSTSLEDFANRIYYMDKVNEQDAETIDRVQQLEDQLTDQKATLEAQKTTQEQRVAEVETRVGEYEELVGEARAYYNQLDAEIQAELARQAEEEARRAEEAAAAESSQQQSAAATVIDVAGGGNDGGDADSGDGGYADTGNDDSGYSSSGSSSDSGSPSSNGSSSDSGSYSSGSSPYPGGGVSSAYSCLGMPYVWGGYNLSTGGFDCSGLVSYCYGDGTWRAGAEPLGLAIQRAGLWKTSLDQLVPGDLVYTRTNFDHVGIYIGDGMMIHAPYPGAVVCVAPVYSFYGGGPFVYPY